MMTLPPLFPVILCGGSGTRLWPVSRRSDPKQFTGLLGERSLFQEAAQRVDCDDFEAPIVVSGNDFRFTIVEQLAASEISPSAILIEPEARNTAPAILAAALHLAERAPDALMLVTPSDHLIPDHKAFQQAVLAAAPRAQAGDLITFGIVPTRPETGYGYLEMAPDASSVAREPQKLSRFVEKPDKEHARKMLDAGNYLWNAGIFLFSVNSLVKAYAECAPDMLDPVHAAVKGAKSDLSFTRLAAEPWSRAHSISIDYAIMERAKNLAVMPYASPWSDLGGWPAVHEEGEADEAGNVCSDNVTAVDCSGSLLRSEDAGIHVVGIGLQDMIAVAMRDAVLIVPFSESQRVGEAVAELKKKGAFQAEQASHDQRPWGWFESLAVGNRFQVKRIMVKPGGSLSLQSHEKRAEHWIVVGGTAKVTIGEEVKEVSENQSVFIPLGEKHRLENPYDEPVTLIEVQTGSYLGEDDIIRYDDVYGRSED
ncbi:mannose-1-phosphate guanylyltransferase/mannose-6-phosphate isomerase [Altererythrobacter sp.]|uniref:mannose-1-phosphate guanylyltransferase/mannose-6-phosphate isomerase n=1 Tax=Altererythrobacter sp. TaxID=1872480 RepID=UPI001B006532|nr:mannose-1-phosphate guanylyltransferase/mannose-6-phosphate isomerase [Altererythrobacter sp.]MBO6944602.1 mannose-1-phosphate guanylyltransferase/mannose-6-phosphate isomerase [Altererythrobacter sp.]